MSVEQRSLLDEPSASLSTCEWFQIEKENFALSSPLRPKVENTLRLGFRQTAFPNDLKVD